MATIRMTASAGAALIALMAIVPATSQAQAPKAPLQLLPGPNQAKQTAGAVTNKAVTNKKAAKAVARTSGKATRTAASNSKATRTNTVVAQPASKTARTNSRTAVTAVRQSQSAASARVATAQRAARPAMVATRPAAPYVVAPAVLPGAGPMPPIVAQGADDQSSQDNVMRGGSSVALVGRLPWWRNDRLEPVTYGSAEADSKVMAAAEAWLAANSGGRATDRASGGGLADDVVDVANADEVNEIDLAAGSVPAPQSPSFLQSLLALIGGAAVAAAASARLLFT